MKTMQVPPGLAWLVPFMSWLPPGREISSSRRRQGFTPSIRNSKANLRLLRDAHLPGVPATLNYLGLSQFQLLSRRNLERHCDVNNSW